MFYHVFFMSDQPTTCPYCGARTDIIADFMHTSYKVQINECPDPACGSIFIEEDDIDQYF
jgi:hypothetical protein